MAHFSNLDAWLYMSFYIIQIMQYLEWEWEREEGIKKRKSNEKKSDRDREKVVHSCIDRLGFFPYISFNVSYPTFESVMDLVCICNMADEISTHFRQDKQTNVETLRLAFILVGSHNWWIAINQTIIGHNLMVDNKICMQYFLMYKSWSILDLLPGKHQVRYTLIWYLMEYDWKSNCKQVLFNKECKRNELNVNAFSCCIMSLTVGYRKPSVVNKILYLINMGCMFSFCSIPALWITNIKRI